MADARLRHHQILSRFGENVSLEFLDILIRMIRRILN